MSRLLNRMMIWRRPAVPYDTALVGPEVSLRMPDCADWRNWHFLRDLSQDFLRPWEPRWPKNALSYGTYCGLLRRQRIDWRSGNGYAFFLFLRSAPQVLIGGITLGDIRHAASQKGTLGYWIGQPYAGCGHMTEAVGLVCDFAFSKLRLQRVEASCLPHNEPSKAVLRNCGFEQEGYARAYLQINGKREDHLLWAKSNPALARKRGA